jgi:hypothetical protein
MDKKIKYKINHDLDKFSGQTLFPEKVDMAKKLLKKIKLPDFSKYQ